MKILICGANGFLGHTVLEHSIRLGWQIDCLVHHNTDRINLFKRNINKLIYSSNNVDDIYDVIFLLNTKISYQKYAVSDKVNSNIQLPLNIIAKCKNAHIIYSSSISLYNDNSNIITELSIPNFNDSFRFIPELIASISKRYSIIRFPSIIGKEMQKGRFLPLIIKKAKEEGIIKIFGQGLRKQNYLAVEDAVDYLLKAAILKAQGVFLGVHPNEYSNIEIAKIVKSYTPRTRIIVEGVDDTPSFTFDNAHSRNILNKHKFISIEKIIKNMVL